MKIEGKNKVKKDRRQARAWMFMHGIRLKDIQLALGQKYHSPTVETLTGVRDHREVLTWLLDNGCPADYLQLPQDMIKDN